MQAQPVHNDGQWRRRDEHNETAACDVLSVTMKGFLQFCLAMLVLLTHAVPVAWLSAPAAATEEKCTMGCCAWLEEAGLGSCGCAALPREAEKPQPASVPPAEGRGLVPQPVMASSVASMPLFAAAAPVVVRVWSVIRPQGSSLRACERRTRLFCSMQT